MPSRRSLLTALAAVTAGCTVGPGSTDTPTQSDSPSPTDDPLVTFDSVDVLDVSADEPVLVAASEWRRWLRRAADGETVRGAVNDPDVCGRAPIDGVTTVALRDAAGRSGTYDASVATGGHYRYPFDAERATPPEDATVYDLSELPEAVATHFQSILETGSGTIEPQTRAYEFVEAHTRQHAEYRYLLYLRWNGTTYRLSARIPTYTPACGFYVVLRLSGAEGAAADVTLSLAGEGELDGVEMLDGESRRLSAYPGEMQALLREFSYVLTVSRCYAVDV